jgi:O-antigen ligase
LAKKTNIKNIKNNNSNKVNFFQENNSLVEIIKILPLIIMIFVLPFIIRLKLIPLQEPFYGFWKGEKINSDFFTYYKQIFIYVITMWAVLHTFLFTKKIKFTKAYYFLAGYALLVILSTIFSKYPQIALNGFIERKEGMWIVLCYILLIISSFNLIESKQQLKAMVYSLGISGSFVSIISIFQYYGMDILSTEFVKNIMISKDIQAQVKDFSIKFGEKYSYGVFYNPNYLGGYISFYAPLMLSYAIISKSKREKIIFTVFFILSTFALYGSRSEAGFLGAVGAIALTLLIFTFRYIIKNKSSDEYKKVFLTRLLPVLLALIIIPISLSYIPISENPLTKIRTQLVKMLEPSDLKNKNYKEVGPINDIIQIDEHTIELVIKNKSTYINVDKNLSLTILDDNKNIMWKENVNEIEEKKNYKLKNNKHYESYVLVRKTQDNQKYGIQYYLRSFSGYLYFVVDNGDIRLADISYKVIDLEKDLKVADYIGFEGKGKLASGRGYIWSRSLPIMFDNIIIGTGQDTFITEFPRYDIYGKQVELSLYNMWTLTDKPHNTYLQIGIHSGLLSLIIVLAGLLILLYKSFKNVIFDDEYLDFNIISFGILGFMISSIFNDSIIAITPIVYILLGINVVGLIKTKNKKADS